jgi:hypothetical protein
VGRDHLEEAIRQLERAGTERERLRALEAVRAAYLLENRDWSRARVAIRTLDAGRLAELEANVAAAWDAYERVAGGSHDLAMRALAGVREALAQRRAATARLSSEPIAIRLTTESGVPIAVMEIPRDEMWDHYKVPREYRDGDLEVALSLSSSPDVRVYKQGKLAWRSPSTPDPKPLPRRALPHEEPTNGTGRHR